MLRAPFHGCINTSTSTVTALPDAMYTVFMSTVFRLYDAHHPKALVGMLRDVEKPQKSTNQSTDQSIKTSYIKAQGWSCCIASYSVLQLLCSMHHGVILAAYNDACALHCLPRCLHARTSCKGEIETTFFPCSQNKDINHFSQKSC